MDFGLSADQVEIRDAAREFLAQRAAPPAVGVEVWPDLVALGWPAIGIGEDAGGAGMGLLEASLLVTEHASAIVSSPLLGTALAAQLIARAGDDEQRGRWLPDLASGAVRGCAGEPSLVGDAVDADVAVVVADGSLALIAAPAVEQVSTIDELRSYGRVTGPAEPLAGDAAAAIAAATVLAAAELVGTAGRALDDSVAHAKTRTQFDRPIGTFQSVAHRCADALVLVEGARAAVLYAGWACDAAPERAVRAASLAKAAASDAAREVTASAIQIHGGIGFTWEAPLHRLYKRAQLSSVLWGSATNHRFTLIKELA